METGVLCSCTDLYCPKIFLWSQPVGFDTQKKLKWMRMTIAFWMKIYVICFFTGRWLPLRIKEQIFVARGICHEGPTYLVHDSMLKLWGITAMELLYSIPAWVCTCKFDHSESNYLTKLEQDYTVVHDWLLSTGDRWWIWTNSTGNIMILIMK